MATRHPEVTTIKVAMMSQTAINPRARYYQAEADQHKYSNFCIYFVSFTLVFFFLSIVTLVSTTGNGWEILGGCVVMALAGGSLVAFIKSHSKLSAVRAEMASIRYDNPELNLPKW
jgi:hypothetical protein